jgi:hypothetical protein
MTTHAINIDKLWTSVEGKIRIVPSQRNLGQVRYLASHTRTTQAELVSLGIILVILQVLDGVLTGVGMAQYGLHMEGNALLRMLMSYVGYIPALVVTKCLAIGIIAILCAQAFRVRWLKYAFGTIIIMYATLAIAPWTYMLTRDLFS